MSEGRRSLGFASQLLLVAMTVVMSIILNEAFSRHRRAQQQNDAPSAAPGVVVYQTYTAPAQPEAPAAPRAFDERPILRLKVEPSDRWWTVVGGGAAYWKVRGTDAAGRHWECYVSREIAEAMTTEATLSIYASNCQPSP